MKSERLFSLPASPETYETPCSADENSVEQGYIEIEAIGKIRILFSVLLLAS
jgi:hypothetical protein